MSLSRCCLALLMLSAGSALASAFAQAIPPAPAIATLREQAGRRFPQPVRARDLVGRDVLAPREAQPVLGRVAAVSQRADGGLDVIVRIGGVLGIGGRRVAVPVEAVALLGEHLALVGLTPAQLGALPDANQQAAPVGDAETVKVGLVKPFH